jgi:hypothetical protein
MNKVEINKQLLDSHAQFIAFINSLSENDFVYAADSKWSAGQQLDHIIKSVSPVSTAFAIPALILKTLFGKANRPSRTYPELVERYQQKLVLGGKAPSRFVPPIIAIHQREKLTRQLDKTLQSLCKRFHTFSEHDLDHFILPHPLLGKLTLREMLYFTIYHAGHHEKNIREALKANKN